MPFTDVIQLAFRAVIVQRLRSFLTLLGIAIGIAAVILLTSIGNGIHRYVLGEFAQFGTNVIGVHPGKVKTGGAASVGLPSSAKPLSLEDAEALALAECDCGNAQCLWQCRGQCRWTRTACDGVWRRAWNAHSTQRTLEHRAVFARRRRECGASLGGFGPQIEA